MDSLLNTNSDLISTKEAARLSQYHPDYLARLTKQHKIRGKQIGRTWFIDRDSLSAFVAEQRTRKAEHASSLSQTRRSEYHTPKVAPEPVVVQAAPAIIESDEKIAAQEPIRSPFSSLVHSRIVALAVALAVVAGGTLGAQAAFIPALGARAGALARATASGFTSIADNAFAHIEAHLAAANDAQEVSATRAKAVASTASGMPITLALSAPQFSAQNTAQPYVALSAPRVNAPAPLNLSAASFVSLVENAPAEVAALNLGLGESVTAAAHAAIGLDVALSYATPSLAQESAKETTLAIGDTGVFIARGVAAAPGAAYAFGTTVDQGAIALGESVARTLFGGEYALAKPFVGATSDVLALDWQAIWGAGNVVEQGGTIAEQSALALSGAALRGAGNTLALAHSLGMPDVENIALGAIGNAARLASSGAARVLAAASLPPLTPVEQIALSTYEYFHELFAPAPIIVMNAPVTAIATTTITRSAANLYPSYTTVVQGVSQSQLNQSINAAKNQLQSQIAALVQPIAAQTIVNENSIQQVNMIQSLSNLVLSTPAITGGSATSIAISNSSFSGTSVSADNGSFANLSVSSALTIPAGSTADRPTGTLGLIRYNTTTHQFEGYGDSDTWAALGGSGSVGINEPLTAGVIGSVLFVGDGGILGQDPANFNYATSTGFFGLGTSTPFARLSLAGFADSLENLFVISTSTASATTTALAVDSNGNLSLLNGANLSVGGTVTINGAALTIPSLSANSILSTNASGTLVATSSPTANYFTATSTTATSTFAGGVDVGNGALTYDSSSGVTSIQNLAIGNLSFATDAGVVSWVDLPVDSTPSAGTAESYSAQIGGTPVLTVYGEADGSGGVQNLSVGISSTTPGSLLSIGTTNGINFGTATSTFSSTGGINLTAGCFAINNTCITGGGGGVTSVSNSDSTLTISPTAGSVVASLNLGNANTWTALQQFTGNATSTELTASNALYNTYLTSGRVPYTTTNGLLTDSSNLTFNGTTLVSGSGVQSNQYNSNSTANGVVVGNTSRNSAAITAQVDLAGGTFSQTSVTSGTFAAVAISPTYNQAGSTAANTDLLINRIETSVGSGLQRLIDAQVAGVSKFNISDTGQTYFSGSVGIGTTSPYANLSVMAGGDYASHAAGTVFAIGSSTAGTATSTLFSVNTTGAVVLNTLSNNPGVFFGTSGAWALAYANVSGAYFQNANSGDLILRSGQNDRISLGINNSTGNNTVMEVITNSGVSIAGTLSSTGATNLATAGTGDVGIGTTSPYANLSVMAGGDYASHAAGTVFAIGSSTAGTATSTLFTVLSNGNVGINNSNPGSELSVTGSISTTNNIIVNTLTSLSRPSSDLIINAGSVTNDNTIFDVGNSTEAGRFTSAGNFGVGTSSPFALLSVSNSVSTPANTPLFAIASTTGGTATTTLFEVGNNLGGGGVFTAVLNGGLTLPLTNSNINLGNGGALTWNNSSTKINGNTSSQFISFTNNSIEAARFQGQDFGIGTTSPFAMLSVQGASNGTTPLFAIGTSTSGTATTTALTIDQNGNLNIDGNNGAGEYFYNTADQTTNYSRLGIYYGGTSYQIVAQKGGSATLQGIHLTSHGDIFMNAGVTPAAIQLSDTSSTANAAIALITGTRNSSSGIDTSLSIIPIINQSSTAGYTALQIQPTETTLGSGSNYLIEAGTSTAPNLFDVTNTGKVGIGTTTPQSPLDVEGAAHVLTDYGIASFQDTLGNGLSTGYDTTNGWDWLYSRRAGFASKPLAFFTSNSSSALPQLLISTSGNVGIGTTSPYANLSVMAGGDYASHAAGTIFAIGSSTAGTATSTLFDVLSNGYLGISSTTPGSLLSIGTTNGINFGTATSTFSSTGGINLTAGCFAVGGNCIGGGTFSNTIANGGTATTTFYASGIVYSDGSKLTQATGSGNSILSWDNTNGRLGIGTSTPWAQLSINPNGITGPAFAIGSSTATNFVVTSGGNVGIGTSSPFANFSVQNTESIANGSLVFQKSSALASGGLIINGGTTGGFADGFTFNGGYVVGDIAMGGSFNATGGNSYGFGTAGPINLTGGNGLSNGGNINLVGGNATSTGNGGTITLAPGTGATASGNVILAPTNGSVGIGTTSPLAALDVYGNLALEGASRYLNFGATSTAGIGSSGYGFRDDNGTMEFKNLGGTWNEVNTATSGPAFSVSKSADQGGFGPNDTTLITWDTVEFDTNNNFSGNKFQPTVAGKYLITLTMNTGESAYSSAQIWKDGSVYIGADDADQVSAVIDMNGTTDYVQAYGYFYSSGTVYGEQNTLFTGALIAPVNANANASLNLQYDGTQTSQLDITKSFGIGTTSPFAKFAVQANPAQLNPVFEVASSSNATFLSVAGTGFGTTTLSGLNISGSATSTSNVGINLTAGCFAINNTCITGGGGGVTSVSNSDSTLTISPTAGSVVASLNLGNANTWTALQQFTGNATSTELTTTGSTYLATSGGNVGIGTTSPYAQLSIMAGGDYASHPFNAVFAIGSSTAGTATSTLFDVWPNGSVAIGAAVPTGEFTVAGTGSAMTYIQNNWSAAKGTWINLSTDGPSGIGTGGAGVNPFLAYASSASNYLNGAVAGDVIYRNANGKRILIGIDNGSGTAAPTMTVSGLNIGIGSTTPFSTLSVTKVSAAANTSLFAVASSTNATLFNVLASGNVGIGTTSPWRTFSITGTAAITAPTVSTTGDYLCWNTTTDEIEAGAPTCSLSSEKVKNSIAGLPSSSGLADIMQLTPVSFKYDAGFGDNGASTQLGFIAEPTAGINPLFAEYATTPFNTPNGIINAGDPDGINWDGITAASVEAIQQIEGAVNTTAFVGAGTAITIDASGNVGIGQAVPHHTLDVNGIAFAQSFAAPANQWNAYLTAEGFGTTTIANTAPAAVLTAAGDVDLYKLALYNAGSISQLADRLTNDENQLTSLEARVAALESGAISDGGFSTSTLGSALNSLGIFVEDGVAQFGTLVADQFVAATNSAGTSSAGSGAISAGSTFVDISNSYVTSTSKIFITFTTPVAGSWYLAQITNGSFRVEFSAAQAGEADFDYFIIQTQGQIATSTPTTSGVGGSPPAGEDVGSGGSDSGSGDASSTPPSDSSPATPPTLTLNGAAAIQLSVGDVWTDPGAAAVSSDGTTDLTAQIVETGSIDPSTVGLYTLNYSVVDPDGASASVSRAVSVVATSTPSDDASSTPTD